MAYLQFMDIKFLNPVKLQNLPMLKIIFYILNIEKNNGFLISVL